MPVTMATALTAQCWPMKRWRRIWNTSSASFASRSASSLATAWEGRRLWQPPWCRSATEICHREFIVMLQSSRWKSPDLSHCWLLSSLNLIILLWSSWLTLISHFHFALSDISSPVCLPQPLCLFVQPGLVERLVVVDISPAQTTTRTNFRYYIQAMQEVKISSDIPRSTARRMAEDQLRSLVKVRTSFGFAVWEYLLFSVGLTCNVSWLGGYLFLLCPVFDIETSDYLFLSHWGAEEENCECKIDIIGILLP